MGLSLTDTFIATCFWWWSYLIRVCRWLVIWKAAAPQIPSQYAALRNMALCDEAMMSLHLSTICRKQTEIWGRWRGAQEVQRPYVSESGEYAPLPRYGCHRCADEVCWECATARRDDCLVKCKQRFFFFVREEPPRMSSHPPTPLLLHLTSSPSPLVAVTCVSSPSHI